MRACSIPFPHSVPVTKGRGMLRRERGREGEEGRCCQSKDMYLGRGGESSYVMSRGKGKKEEDHKGLVVTVLREGEGKRK